MTWQLHGLVREPYVIWYLNRQLPHEFRQEPEVWHRPLRYQPPWEHLVNLRLKITKGGPDRQADLLRINSTGIAYLPSKRQFPGLHDST